MCSSLMLKQREHMEYDLVSMALKTLQLCLKAIVNYKQIPLTQNGQNKRILKTD